jgi:hypothetical protein
VITDKVAPCLQPLVPVAAANHYRCFASAVNNTDPQITKLRAKAAPVRTRAGGVLALPCHCSPTTSLHRAAAAAAAAAAATETLWRAQALPPSAPPPSCSHRPCVTACRVLLQRACMPGVALLVPLRGRVSGAVLFSACGRQQQQQETATNPDTEHSRPMSVAHGGARVVGRQRAPRGSCARRERIRVQPSSQTARLVHTAPRPALSGARAA